MKRRRRLFSLEEAAHFPDSYAVFGADSGGQVMATCPLPLLRCDEATVKRLADDLGVLLWNDDTGGVSYERYTPPAIVGGGMGGGQITGELWIHPTVVRLGLAPEIEAVIAGTRTRLPMRPVYVRVVLEILQAKDGELRIDVVTVTSDPAEAHVLVRRLQADDDDPDFTYDSVRVPVIDIDEALRTPYPSEGGQQT
jgi:hypothetical protein